MKILQINSVYNILSTGRNCAEIQTEIESQGHECFTAYGLYKEKYRNTYFIPNKLDRKIHSALSRITGLQGYFSVLATIKLLKFMDRNMFDIVHLNNLHSHQINLPLLFNYLKKHKIATVITIHDCWFFTGKCMHYTQTGCYKWQAECGNCPRIKNDIPSWTFDFTKKMRDDKEKWIKALDKVAVIGVSDWITNEVKKSFLKDMDIVTRIYNWIDLEIFKPVDTKVKDALGIADKKVIIGVSSGWNVNKGFDLIVSMAKKLPENQVMVLVGGELKNVYDNIIHIPQTDDTKQLANYYSMADCFISMSQQETFGKTVAEALACGVPVVVFNATALPEIVNEGCGEIAEVNNADDFYNKIQRVITNGKDHYSKNCREYAKQYFDMHKNIKEYINVYKELLDMKKSTNFQEDIQ